MKLGFFVAMTMSLVNASAAELAVYRGSFDSNVRGGYVDMRAGTGQWLSAPANCRSLKGKIERGFALHSEDPAHARNYRCADAKIYLDVSESSFCRPMNGPDIYYPPVLVSVQCLQ